MSDELVLIPARFLRDDIAYRSVSLTGQSVVIFCGFQTADHMEKPQDGYVELIQWQLLYVLEGQAVYQLHPNGQRITIQAGDILQIPAGTRYRLMPDENSGWACVRLGLDANFADQLVKTRIINHDRFVMHVGVQLPLVETFDQIPHALRNSPDDALPWSALSAQQLIMELTHQPAREDDLLPICRNYLMDHLDQPIKIEELARLSHIPSSQLRITFSKRTGMELVEYQQRLRIDRAISMLGDYSISLEDIAHKLGYDNTGDLGVQFKRITGQSPLQYRQRLF